MANNKAKSFSIDSLLSYKEEKESTINLTNKNDIKNEINSEKKLVNNSNGCRAVFPLREKQQLHVFAANNISNRNNDTSINNNYSDISCSINNRSSNSDQRFVNKNTEPVREEEFVHKGNMSEDEDEENGVDPTGLDVVNNDEEDDSWVKKRKLSCIEEMGKNDKKMDEEDVGKHEEASSSCSSRDNLYDHLASYGKNLEEFGSNHGEEFSSERQHQEFIKRFNGNRRLG